MRGYSYVKKKQRIIRGLFISFPRQKDKTKINTKEGGGEIEVEIKKKPLPYDSENIGKRVKSRIVCYLLRNLRRERKVMKREMNVEKKKVRNRKI